MAGISSQFLMMPSSMREHQEAPPLHLEALLKAVKAVLMKMMVAITHRLAFHNHHH